MRIAALFVAYSAIFTSDGTSVFAEEASDHTLSEITVSARKRDENLKKVPASITVVTSADLQATYTGSLAVLTDAAPNVAFYTVGEFGHSSSLDIRAVGGGAANLDTDPAVPSTGEPPVSAGDEHLRGAAVFHAVERLSAGFAPSVSLSVAAGCGASAGVSCA